MNSDFFLPNDVLFLLEQLNKSGFESWIVGGCVRDLLLGLQPNDWDICTNALPHEIQHCFQAFRMVDAGLKHGTITVVLNNVTYEITTYRTDGSYSDNRHPDRVVFVNRLSLDLQRRDFTINAMAYHPQVGLIDENGGREDLANRRLRCVGNAIVRFEEDALRILRCARFASTLDFQIDAETTQAMKSKLPLLKCIAAERIHVEITKLLCGKASARILNEVQELFRFLLPSLRSTKHNWRQTIQAIERACTQEASVLYALLLHADTEDTAETDAITAECELKCLRMDNQTIASVKFLVAHQYEDLSPERSNVLYTLNRFTSDRVERLLIFQNALFPNKADQLCEFKWMMNCLLRENACYTLKQLAINGSDLISLGITPGEAIGNKLQKLLDAVISGKVPNDREALLAAIEVHNDI